MALRRVGGAGDERDGDRSESTFVVLRDPHFLRNHQSSLGSSSFDSLAEEELVEILRRLPLKLATRCKSVAKEWHNLISSNHFATSYLRSRNTAPPQFALINRYDGIIGSGMFRETPSSSDSLVKLNVARIPPPNPVSRSVEFQFLAASNGWVLCSYPYRFGEIYYVVNPLTKYRITLPPIPRTSFQNCRVRFTFCADSSINSFRVVRLNIPDKTALKVDIFSSETGQWAQSTLSFSSELSVQRSKHNDSPLNNHAIALNGKLHWLYVWFKSEIFVYDPYEPEKYHRMSLPKDCWGSQYCLGTCHCEGQARPKHLKYLECNKGAIRVWELKDYDRVEWSLLHRVHVSEFTSLVTGIEWYPGDLRFVFHPDVVAFHPWDGDIVVCYHKLERLLQYNMRLKTLEPFLEEGQEIRNVIGMTGTVFFFELPWWPTPVPSPPNLINY